LHTNAESTLDVEEEFRVDLARRDDGPARFADWPEQGNADVSLRRAVPDKESNTLESRDGECLCPPSGFSSRGHRVDLTRNTESPRQRVRAIGKPHFPGTERTERRRMRTSSTGIALSNP
jgi:hypothetical protein